MLMSMTASQEVPQGLLFNRGGCSSATVTQQATVRVRSVVQATVVRPVATFLANRPRLFAARGGCGGSALVQSTGCGGGGGFIPQATLCDPAATTVWYESTQAAPPMTLDQAKFLGERVERAVVHRMLTKALRHDSLTPAQRAVAAACLADPDLYDAAVIKVTRDLKKAPLAGEPFGRVGKIGDGTILKLLIDNLPQIIAAIEQIIKLFGAQIINSAQMYVMIDALLAPYEQVWEQLPPLWKLAA